MPHTAAAIPTPAASNGQVRFGMYCSSATVDFQWDWYRPSLHAVAAAEMAVPQQTCSMPGRSRRADDDGAIAHPRISTIPRPSRQSCAGVGSGGIRPGVSAIDISQRSSRLYVVQPSDAEPAPYGSKRRTFSSVTSIFIFTSWALAAMLSTNWHSKANPQVVPLNSGLPRNRS